MQRFIARNKRSNAMTRNCNRFYNRVIRHRSRNLGLRLRFDREGCCYNDGVKRPAFAAAIIAALVLCRLACAQGAADGGKPVNGTARLNFSWRTFGGEQFWSDELVYGQWRIQRQA